MSAKHGWQLACNTIPRRVVVCSGRVGGVCYCLPLRLCGVQPSTAPSLSLGDARENIPKLLYSRELY